MNSPSIVWLRDDLRVSDNPALTAAVNRGEPVVLVYVLDDESAEIRPLGAASRWWLHHSLTALSAEIGSLGGELTLRQGPARDVITELVRQTGAGAVYWNRRYGASRDIDVELKASLAATGLEVHSFTANLLHDPWAHLTQSGSPFKVFTPFWKSFLATHSPREPLPAPASITPANDVASDALAAWQLTPTRDWADRFPEWWTPGEAGAHARLDDFLTNGITQYDRRDEPGVDSTSRLSPHLRFGEISPYQVWHETWLRSPAGNDKNRDRFLSEVGWREFSYHQLFNNTDISTRNLRPEFDAFPWKPLSSARLRAWKKGLTGVSLVDAGMRELWISGTMHNRVRMVCASFLIKNLGIDWRIGEQWFWDTLVDADEASNPASWQWVAGSGYDAAPYFRVFNPELQAEKFDGQRVYRNRWIPELGSSAYPEPIINLAQSRTDALNAYTAMRESGEPPRP